jgi:hypothetical protein
MICPTCKAVVDVLEGTCPTCQRDPAYRSIVEGSLVDAPPTRTPAPVALDDLEQQGSSLFSMVTSASSSHSLVTVLPKVPALLWRQPVVRAAVRTGASAIALSLTVRMARRVLAQRSVTASAVDSGLLALAKQLAPDARPKSARHRGHRHVEITETLIYIQRFSQE